MSHFVRLVGELKPKAVVLENVRNLAKLGDGAVFRNTISGLSKLGFSLWHDVLSAADFGVPQARKRLIVIGMRGRHAGSRTRCIAWLLNLLPHVTTRNAIGDLPDAGEYGVIGHP